MVTMKAGNSKCAFSLGFLVGSCTLYVFLRQVWFEESFSWQHDGKSNLAPPGPEKNTPNLTWRVEGSALINLKHPHQPGLVESNLTSGITVWYGNTTLAETKLLQRVIKTPERVIGSNLPSMDTIYTQRCKRKAQSILKDKHHLAYALFKWVDTGYNLRHRRPLSI